MADMHSDPMPQEARDLETERYNARVGLILFAIYLLVYGSFVFINAFWPGWMDVVPLAGLNVAVLFGLGLIVGAFVLALIYAWLCRTPKKEGM